MHRTTFCRQLLPLFSFLFLGIGTIQAQNQIGAHFGVVQPLFGIQDGDFSGAFDPYTIGFPIGITVRKSANFAFDAEFVPFITEGTGVLEGTDQVTLLVHPGLLWKVGESLTYGTRLAYEVGGIGRYGFTPLLNQGILVKDQTVFFEFVLPVRMGSGQGLSVGAGLHIGVGF